MGNSNRNWGDIGKDIIETVLKYANTSAQQIIEEKKRKFSRKLIAIVLISLGLLFLLNGLAQFINQIMDSNGWHGYVIIGSVITLIGIFFSRD